MSVKDKVIVVTGAGSGIGRATALHLGSLGARLVLGARREAQIAEVAERLAQQGHHVLACARQPADLAALGRIAGI